MDKKHVDLGRGYAEATAVRISVILWNTFGRCSERETNIITTHTHTTICHPKSHLPGTYTYIYSDTGPRRGLPYPLVETWRLALCAPLRPPQWIRAGAAAGQSALRKAARRVVSVIAEVCGRGVRHTHTPRRGRTPHGRAGERAGGPIAVVGAAWCGVGVLCVTWVSRGCASAAMSPNGRWGKCRGVCGILGVWVGCTAPAVAVTRCGKAVLQRSSGEV